MALRVIGAGLGRTGTNSLKVALEALLGGRCYHMFEAAARPGDTPFWERAVRGERVDWEALLGGFVAAVDWPACAFWRELLQANPDAYVLLSTRDSPTTWWNSMQATIISTQEQPVPLDEPDTAQRRAMIREMLDRRFTSNWRDREAAIAAYEAHSEEVRRTVPHRRLIDWQPGDGWGPICSALELPIPDLSFPHLNTTAEFRSSQKVDLTPPTAA